MRVCNTVIAEGYALKCFSFVQVAILANKNVLLEESLLTMVCLGGFFFWRAAILAALLFPRVTPASLMRARMQGVTMVGSSSSSPY